MYTYIYIYRQRERERERESDRKPQRLARGAAARRRGDGQPTARANVLVVRHDVVLGWRYLYDATLSNAPR